jgi:hypothetical protein
VVMSNSRRLRLLPRKKCRPASLYCEFCGCCASKPLALGVVDIYDHHTLHFALRECLSWTHYVSGLSKIFQTTEKLNMDQNAQAKEQWSVVQSQSYQRYNRGEDT